MISQPSTTCRFCCGHLDLPRKDGGGGGRCHLTRIHLEEDTGKLTHGDGGFSEVDLNRGYSSFGW